MATPYQPYSFRLPHVNPAGSDRSGQTMWTTDQLTRNFRAIEDWQRQETGRARALRILDAWGYPNVSAPTWGPGATPGEYTIYSFTVNPDEFRNNGGWWYTAGGLVAIAGASMPWRIKLNGTTYVQMDPTTGSGEFFFIQAMLVNYWTTNGSYWANFQYGADSFPVAHVSAPASPTTTSPITVSLTATIGASDSIEFFNSTFALLPPILELR